MPTTQRGKVVWDPPHDPPWARGGGAANETPLMEVDEEANATADHHHEQKSVEWIELLFDLILVIAVAKITELISEAALDTLPAKVHSEFRCVSDSTSHNRSAFISNGGGGNHHLLRRLDGDEDHNATDTLFGLPSAGDFAVSALIAFLLVMRIWQRETLLHSSQKAGLDALGRIRVFLLMWTFSGITVFLGRPFSYEFASKKIFQKYTIACFWQFLAFSRLYYHSPVIRQIWGWSPLGEMLLELILMFGCVVMVMVNSTLDVTTHVMCCLGAFFSVYLFRVLYARRLFMSSVLRTTNVHHYAERYGLMMVIVLGECLLQLTRAHDVFANHENVSMAARERVETTSFWVSLLCYVVLCSFFWMYFDNHDPDVWTDNGAYLQSLHLPLIFCVSAVAAALNHMLVQINCSAYFASYANDYEQTRSVPLVISFLFSGCLAGATFIQGLIRIVAVKHKGVATGWWQAQHSTRLNAYNVLRSTLVLLVPVFAGMGGATVVGLAGVAAMLSAAMVAIDACGLCLPPHVRRTTRTPTHYSPSPSLALSFVPSN